MQMEALECGAASLTMILAYYEKCIPLAQVRADCGVSRDGSNAKNVLKAARSYGLTAKGYRYEPDDLKKSGNFPCIIHWNFNHTAYGMVSGAFMSLAGITASNAQFGPIIEMAKPIMDTIPEVSEGKLVVDRLSGGIELNNISFRCNENMPLVINDLSLKIRSGQYVAIVGSTGCGKSTLMRIMLGFEKPQKGAVYYDGKDLNTMDLKSLRRKSDRAQAAYSDV